MSLADQIIDHEPWHADVLPELHCTGTELNALRDELIAGRRLRTAAEARESSPMTGLALRHAATKVRAIRPGIDPNAALAAVEALYAMGWRPPPVELVRRSDEHSEGGA